MKTACVQKRQISAGFSVRLWKTLWKEGTPYGGNALEVKEAVEFLRLEHLENDLKDLCLEISSCMLSLSGIGGYEECKSRALKALESVTGEKYETLNIIGGGSKNALLNELTKKYTGKQIITGPAEGTAIGNLMMQMVGLGDISSDQEGREIIKNSFDIAEV